MNDHVYSSFLQDDVIRITTPEEMEKVAYGHIDPKKDTYPHNYAKTTYQQGRKDRLDDLIMDYLTDEDTEPSQFAFELKESIQSCVDYFENYAKKSNKMLKLVDTIPKVELF
jgi:geranylgeranyl pyrophosphate synthase